MLAHTHADRYFLSLDISVTGTRATNTCFQVFCNLFLLNSGFNFCPCTHSLCSLKANTHANVKDEGIWKEKQLNCDSWTRDEKMDKPGEDLCLFGDNQFQKLIMTDFSPHSRVHIQSWPVKLPGMFNETVPDPEVTQPQFYHFSVP